MKLGSLNSQQQALQFLGVDGQRQNLSDLQVRGQSIGWLPLEAGAYLHVCSEGKEDRVVITGVPDAGLDEESVLLLV